MSRSAGGLAADDSGMGRAQKRVALLNVQGGGCAICSRANAAMVVDHDHGTGLMRGLLCRSCNLREGRQRWSWSGEFAADVAAYLASPPAAHLRWLWSFPDWWRPADTTSARKLGLSVADYATRYASAARYLDHLTNHQAVTALAAVQLPALGAQ